MHNTDTVFPESIDSRFFFSDASLKEKDLLNGHHELIKSEHLKEASQYLYDNVEAGNRDVSYNGAYIWNTFDNRVIAIEEYVASHSGDTKVRPTYSDTEPAFGQRFVGMVWV